MTFTEASAKIWEGNCLAFLGSGFSKGAQNTKDEEFPTAKEFKQELIVKGGGLPEGDLADAADSFRSSLGDDTLITLLTERFTTKTVASCHETTCSAPWRRVYTTNYDDVFEIASKLNGKSIHSVSIKDDPYTLTIGKPACVHLNGSIVGLTSSDLDTNLKLTDTSYVTSSIVNSPWAATFRDDIRIADAIFFIGYSLYDLDIKRLIFDAAHLASKTFFILGSNPDALTEQKVRKYGTLVKLDTSGFATELLKAKPAAGTLIPHSYKAVTRFEAQSANAPLRDTEVFDLFELGYFVERKIEQSISTQEKYYCGRNIESQILDLFFTGAHAVVVTGALGNGKTLLTHGFSVHAAANGFQVFRASEKLASSTVEFERLARTRQKTILIIDDYPGWFPEIRAYALANNGNCQLLLAARDTIHDAHFERLERELNKGPVPEVNADRLSKGELTWWAQCLDQYGLWGEKAGESPYSKETFLRASCEGEIRGILLRLLRSTDIGNRLKKLVEDNGKRCPYLDVAASVFILSTLKNAPLRIETLADIWGIDLVSGASFRTDPTISSLIDFSRWAVKVRSAVVSEYFLKNVFGSDVAPVLIKVMRTLSAGYRGNVTGHRAAFEELMRYSTLQHILPEKGRLNAAIRFYEGVKDLPQAARHPLFWLQYGIACLAENDLRRASKYFETAYSYAKAQQFDAFQIDNHFARFLLEEASQEDLPILKAMENFRRAKSIINRQMQRERVSYPYSVAALYQNFFDKFRSKFNRAQIVELMTAVELVESHLGSADRNRKFHRAFSTCRVAMDYVREQCSKLLKEGN